MDYGLGIDVGTTFTAAAVATSRTIEICTLGTRAAAIPTVVLLRADGEVLVGEPAERRAATEPERAAFAFKRRLGDPTPIVLAGSPYGAETLVGHVLRSVVTRVTETNGAPPARVVLTHPASFGEYKLDLLRQAARLAGLTEVSFVAEPQAAAVHYAESERLAPGSVVAVYDFGGGTFDAALVRRTDSGFEVIGRPEGLERLGGVDLDHAVLLHVLRAIGMDHAEATDPQRLDPQRAEAFGRLRAECRNAKEALSSDADATVSVSFPDLVTQVRITRPEFEDMVRPRIADTVEALRRAVRSAGLEMDQVDRILLVGGTSRIPLVAELVRSATGRPIAIDVHPKHSVAMGAATLARATSAAAPPPVPPPPTLRPAPVPPPPTPVPAPPTPATAPSMTPGVTESVVVAATATPAPLRRSRTPVLVGCGVAVVAAMAAIAFVVTRDTGGGDNAATDASAADSAPTDTAPADTAAAGTVPPATAPPETVPATTVPAETTPVTTVGAGPVEGEQPFAALLPRTTTFGSVAMSLDDFVLRRQDPESFEAQLPVAADGPLWGYATLTLTNTLTFVPLATTGTDFAIRLTDGTTTSGVHVDEPTQITPKRSGTAIIAFELYDGVDLADAAIVVNENGRTPATIALSTTPAPDPAPVTFAIDTSVLVAGGDGNTSTWAVGQATSSFDADYDSDDYAGGELAGARRAPADTRFINVPVTITGDTACQCDTVSVQGSMAWIEIAGTNYPNVNEFAETLAPGGSMQTTLSFNVPVGATAARLFVADHPIDISLP